MKLFYHFLIFVFVSLILVACANMFNSDSKTNGADTEPSTLENSQNVKQNNDSMIGAREGNPYTFASFKYSTSVNEGDAAEKECDCKKHRRPVNDLQTAFINFNQNHQF